MRKEIIGIFLILVMLFAVSNSVVGLNKDPVSKDIEHMLINKDDNIELSLVKASGFFGVDLIIENTGGSALTELSWSFRSKAAITGTGIFISENLQEGQIDELASGEKKVIMFRPFSSEFKSPIGLGNIYLNASIECQDIFVRTQQRAFILGLFLGNYKDTYMDIKPPEAYERWQNEEFDLIIDVVGLDIYSLGHLPGAVNYVWADGTLRSKISELDPDLNYLVYCHTDPPSTDSAQALVDAGFENIFRLEGNFKAWKDAGYPIEI